MLQCLSDQAVSQIAVVPLRVSKAGQIPRPDPSVESKGLLASCPFVHLWMCCTEPGSEGTKTVSYLQHFARVSPYLYYTLLQVRHGTHVVYVTGLAMQYKHVECPECLLKLKRVMRIRLRLHGLKIYPLLDSYMSVDGIQGSMSKVSIWKWLMVL
jgi:hypothetical protein